jgi:hypothetical protein
MGTNTTSNDVVAEIIRLYRDEKMPPSAISQRLGVTKRVIYSRLDKFGATRTHSEARAVPTYKQRPTGVYHGNGGWWQSTKTGKWEHGMSSYELVRMQQLDADESVISWTRTVDPIPMPNGKKYIPDFTVNRSTGITIEEIKPAWSRDHAANTAKYEVAREHLKEKGIVYVVLTEKELGINQVSGFRKEGLQQVDDQFREERRKKRNRDGAKKRRKENPDKKKEYDSQNKERFTEYRKQYRAKTRDAILAKKKVAFQKIKIEQPEQYAKMVEYNRERRRKIRAAKEQTLCACL